MIGKVLLLGAVAMDVVLDSDSLPRDDGFEILRREQLVPGGQRFQCGGGFGGSGRSGLSDRADWR